MTEETTQEMFWAAQSYGEVLSPWQWRHETQEFLHTGDGWPSCLGYCGELKLNGEWHSLWQFNDRAKAEEFCSQHKERVFTQAQVAEFVANGQLVKHNAEEAEDEVIDPGYIVIAEGVFLYDGSVPSRIALLRRPVHLASTRWIEAEDGRFIIDIDSPIPTTADGYVYYVDVTQGGEFTSEREAKDWADKQPWGPVRWEAVEPRLLSTSGD